MLTYLIRFLLGFFLLGYACSSMATENFQFMIMGLTGDAKTNAQNRLQVLEQHFGEKLSTEDIQNFYQQAPKNLQEALEPYGYFHATIKSQLLHKKNQWEAQFFVSTNAPLRIAHLFLQVEGPGKESQRIQNYVEHFSLHEGQVFISPDYEKAKKQLFNLALEEGYLSAFFITQKVAVKFNDNSCDITLILNTGPRFYFGLVSFSPSPLSYHFLQRYISFKSGQPFSSEKLRQMQNILGGSNYFKQVSIESHIDQAQDGKVPIYVHLNPRKKQQYLFGLGFGTDTGPRLTAGTNWRYVNSSGHYINSQWVLSPVQSSLQASYVIPGTHPATDQYALNTSVTQNHLNQGDSKTEQIGASDIKLYTNAWQRTFSLNYAIEQFQLIGEPNQRSHLLIPGISFSKTSYNDQLFPMQGNRFLISAQGSLHSAISDTSFFQTEIQDKFITHFGDHNRFILRGDVGYTAVHDIDLFPLSLRFYAGGSQSVRGFSYQSLGPGRYLATGSAEFQQRITGKWYGALFFDAGNASNTLNMNLQRSTGIGLVWASPIGTMELTLAQAQSLPGRPLRIQFVMGPDL